MVATVQNKRTATAGNVPANGSLAQGQFAVGMADTPPTLYVGVPTSINANGVAQIIGTDSATGFVTLGMLAAATGDIQFTVTY
jgi:hypothetical protein